MSKRLQIIILIALIPFAIYFWPTSLGGDTTIMMVQGQSMLPTILPGSLLVAKAAPEYNIGDIVAYEQRDGGASKIVVHRIIDVDNNGFIIKGDNNPKKDAGYPTEDEILGTVLFSTPYVGDILGLFRNPIALVISSVGILGIQMEKKRRKEREKGWHIHYKQYEQDTTANFLFNPVELIKHDPVETRRLAIIRGIERDIAELKKQKDEEIKQKDAMIRWFQNSKSWRITSPLRWLDNFVKKIIMWGILRCHIV